MTTGEQLKFDGQDATLAAATVGYHDHPGCIDAAMSVLIRAGQPFSADHVRTLLPADTLAWMADHVNVLPAVFGKHSRAGLIRHVGWCAPTRRQRHSNPNRVWVSTAVDL